jgi:hypothetical protein
MFMFAVVIYLSLLSLSLRKMFVLFYSTLDIHLYSFSFSTPVFFRRSVNIILLYMYIAVSLLR